MDDGDDDKDGEDGSSETRKFEQDFILFGVKAAQLRDLVEATSGSHNQRSQLSRLELEIDKTLLRLLAIECREGEERGMRALEMVQLMKDRTGRTMDAASKMADHYGRTILGTKIREIAEKRIGGLEEEDF
jgi:chromosome transmission fidelity protein 4